MYNVLCKRIFKMTHFRFPLSMIAYAYVNNRLYSLSYEFDHGAVITSPIMSTVEAPSIRHNDPRLPWHPWLFGFLGSLGVLGFIGSIIIMLPLHPTQYRQIPFRPVLGFGNIPNRKNRLCPFAWMVHWILCCYFCFYIFFHGVLISRLYFACHFIPFVQQNTVLLIPISLCLSGCVCVFRALPHTQL